MSMHCQVRGGERSSLGMRCHVGGGGGIRLLTSIEQFQPRSASTLGHVMYLFCSADHSTKCLNRPMEFNGP